MAMSLVTSPSVIYVTQKGAGSSTASKGVMPHSCVKRVTNVYLMKCTCDSFEPIKYPEHGSLPQTGTYGSFGFPRFNAEKY